MGLASDEMIQRGCCFIGKLTCGDTHADTRTELSVGCLIATPPFYLYLASQRSRAMGEPGRHQRQVCEGTWSSAARVTCDYRSEDLNEYTIFGPFAASLCGAGNSQSAVYPIIAPCLYAPPEQLGVQLLCWGAILEELRRKVSELLIPISMKSPAGLWTQTAGNLRETNLHSCNVADYTRRTKLKSNYLLNRNIKIIYRHSL